METLNYRELKESFRRKQRNFKSSDRVSMDQIAEERFQKALDQHEDILTRAARAERVEKERRLNYFYTYRK